MQPEGDDQIDRHQDDQIDRQARNPALGQDAEIGRKAGDRTAIGDEKREPRTGRHGGQRRHKGLDAAIGGQDAVYQPDKGPKCQPRQAGQREGHAHIAVEPGVQHQGNGQNRPHRQINPTDDDHQRRPRRHDADIRDLRENVEQVP